MPTVCFSQLTFTEFIWVELKYKTARVRQTRCVHVDTNTTDKCFPWPVMSHLTDKDSLSCCWALWHFHTTLPGSVGITLRLYQALNLGQALFQYPPPPCLSLPHQDLLALDKKNPKHVPCSAAAETSGWLSDGGHKAWKRKKNTAHFSPSLPPSALSYLSRHRCSHPSSHGNSVYQGSPALLSSLIRFLTLAQSLSIFFPFDTFQYVRLGPLHHSPSLTLAPLPTHTHLISLIICLCLHWSANDSLLANSWDWSFLHGWVGLLKGPLSSRHSAPAPLAMWHPHPRRYASEALSLNMHWAQLPGGESERLWESRREEESGVMSEWNTNKVQHSRKRSREKMAFCATKSPLHLLQRASISASFLPRVCVCWIMWRRVGLCVRLPTSMHRYRVIEIFN